MAIEIKLKPLRGTVQEVVLSIYAVQDGFNFCEAVAENLVCGKLLRSSSSSSCTVCFI